MEYQIGLDKDGELIVIVKAMPIVLLPEFLRLGFDGVPQPMAYMGKGFTGFQLESNDPTATKVFNDWKYHLSNVQKIVIIILQHETKLQAEQANLPDVLVDFSFKQSKGAFWDATISTNTVAGVHEFYINLYKVLKEKSPAFVEDLELDSEGFFHDYTRSQGSDSVTTRSQEPDQG